MRDSLYSLLSSSLQAFYRYEGWAFWEQLLWRLGCTVGEFLSIVVTRFTFTLSYGVILQYNTKTRALMQRSPSGGQMEAG